MSKILAPILLVLSLTAVGIIVIFRFTTDRVEQTMIDGARALCGNGYGGYCYVTYVWRGRDLIEAWYDNPNTLNDSIKNARVHEGLQLLNSVKTKITYK